MKAPSVNSIFIHGLLRFARVLLLAVVGYSVLLFLVQRPVAFPGARLEPPREEPVPPAGATQVWLTPSFGRVEAWLFPAGTGAPGPALLFVHANGEIIDYWEEEMASLADEGLTVLLPEFPGYGFSEGKPSRDALEETFVEAYDWLARQPSVDRERIVVWGRSLGGGVASDLVMERSPAAFILQSTFSSASTLAWQTFYVPGFLVRDRWDNRKAVLGYGGPILLMHGRTDEVIPFSHAEALAALREGLEVTEIGCGHNDCMGEWPRILETARGFLKDLGIW